MAAKSQFCRCGGVVDVTYEMRRHRDLQNNMQNQLEHRVETCRLCRRRTIDGLVVDIGTVSRPATAQLKRGL